MTKRRRLRLTPKEQLKRAKAEARKKNQLRLRQLLFDSLAQHGLPLPTPEFQFHHERQWRADFAWPSPDHMVILEVEGGTWTQGRHTRGSGFRADVEKYNAAAAAGYRLLRCFPEDLRSERGREALCLLIKETLLSRQDG